MSRAGWDYPEDIEPLQEDPGFRGRLILLRLFIILMVAILLYRVIWLQQNQGIQWQAQAEDNRFATITVDPARGVIFDRNGLPLAENLPSFDVTIIPAFLPDDEAELQAVYLRLSELTNVPITNTIQQQELIASADPATVNVYTQLANLYGESVADTLNEAGVVPLLPESIAGTVETFSFAQFLPAVITNNVPISMAYQVELESTYLPGVQVLERPLRDYPSGEYTAHIIGYTGPIPDESYLDRYERDDRVGWSGVEYTMEDTLAGVKGERQIEVDWTGRELRQIGLSVPPEPGHNIHLTIDVELQEKVQKIMQGWIELRRQVPDRDQITGQEEFLEVEQAAVVVLNPNTGEILALGNLPTFDNNRFANEVPVDYYLGLVRNDYTPLVNHAISGTYPPGSVYKLVTAAAAMQEGIVSPERLLTAPGDIIIPNRFAPNDPGRSQQFVCWYRAGHGLMNMWGGLANSCDIYFYKVAGGFDQDGEFVDVLGVDRLHEYSLAFGMGQVQGIELPLEAPGNIPTQAWKRQTQGEGWSTGDDYNMAIGQGFVTNTPLQVAQMAAVIASQGFLYKPTIIHHITDVDGNIVQDFEPVVLNTLDVDRQYLDIIAESMYLVTQPPESHPQINAGGTAAYVTWLEEYGINTAGKTGTAEYCDNIAIQRGWCIAGEILPTHSWYVGYAPYEDPEIVVASFIFNGGEGSLWAATLTRDVMEAYFEVGPFAPDAPDPFDPVYVPTFRGRTFDNIEDPVRE
jgi:penicillin-binding protein 2